MQSIVVTGGAGYVGSVLVRRLLAEGYDVTCIDTLRFGRHSLAGVIDHPRYALRETDITDHQHVDRVLGERQHHAVVHLAAIVGDPACALEPELAHRTNVDASVHLIERARAAGVERFVFASTCSNYGKMSDPNGSVGEESPLAPVSLYARQKVECEEILLHRIPRTPGFAPTALRSATVFGLSPRMRFDLTVNEFTKELVLGRELDVFGEQFWRPYCHVKDFAGAILLTLKSPLERVAYNVFNVGDFAQNYTKKMIVDALLARLPHARIRFVRREEDSRDYRVRFDKIRTDLGFRISMTVPDGIDEIAQALTAGEIRDPNDPRYYNTPTGQG